ncbi:MAG: metallophosphoesterase family protein [Thermomicrobiales bacterium]
MSDAALHPHLRGVRAGLILTGHTHIPLIRRWGESTIVNPGAVAQPSGVPPPTPTCALGLADLSPYKEIDLRAVPYDNAAAIRGLRAIADHNPFVPKLADLIAPPPTRP